MEVLLTWETLAEVTPEKLGELVAARILINIVRITACNSLFGITHSSLAAEISVYRYFQWRSYLADKRNDKLQLVLFLKQTQNHQGNSQPNQKAIPCE